LLSSSHAVVPIPGLTLKGTTVGLHSSSIPPIPRMTSMLRTDRDSVREELLTLNPTTRRGNAVLWDDSGGEGKDDELGTIVGIEFGHGSLDVGLDRPVGDPELGRDLLVGPSASDMGQDVQLTARE
jgi:hypothetical protein